MPFILASENPVQALKHHEGVVTQQAYLRLDGLSGFPS